MNRSTIRNVMLTLVLSMAVGTSWAKLPPPTEEQKAKAAEAGAKAAEAAKNEAELLTKAQDRVAEYYVKSQKAKGVAVKPVNAPSRVARPRK